MSVLLAARGASRTFGVRRVLEPCDIELQAGELVGLVGPNGAGKSTLLSILAGALDPTEGHVERGVRTGWAPQRPALYGRLTPRENIALFARLDGLPVPAELGLRLPDTPAATHSVGMRQRLNLALAFLGDPEVLLLDEPSASLDHEQRELLWERVAALLGAGGAVCFATQHADEVGRADRTIELREGRLVDGG